MLCSTCNKSFDGVARFCTGCGQPLQTPMSVRGTLTRARYGRMIAGVCAGFAQAYGLDVTLVRLLVCVATFCGAGVLVLAYIAAWIIMPNAPYALPMQPSQPTGAVAS